MKKCRLKHLDEVKLDVLPKKKSKVEISKKKERKLKIRKGN